MKKIKYICPKCKRTIKNYKSSGTCQNCGWYQKPLPR